MEQLNLAVIGFDSMQLLLPQEGIATIEMIDTMELSDGAAGAVGSLRTGGREYPVYALDASLELLTTIETSVGTGHLIQTDSRGNLYIAATGVGYERLIFTGLSTPAAD